MDVEIEQSAIIKIFWPEGCTADNIQEGLRHIYGEPAYANSTVLTDDYVPECVLREKSRMRSTCSQFLRCLRCLRTARCRMVLS
jgi:hypothetical protein